MPPDSTTFALRSLSVHEVSGVDRPANKRKFLIVKSEDQMPNSTKRTMVDRGDGILVAKEDTQAPAPASIDTIDATVKEGLALTKDAKEKLSGHLVTGAKRLTALAAAIEHAPDGDGTELTPAFAREVDVVARHLSSMVPTVGDDADKAAPVGKAGRKISQARAAKLRELQQSVNSLCAELGIGDDADDGDDADKDGDKVAKNAAPVVDEKLTKAIVDLATLVKAQGEQIKRLTTAPGSSGSNALEPGERPTGESVKKAAVRWPSNLNAPGNDDECFD